MNFDKALDKDILPRLTALLDTAIAERDELDLQIRGLRSAITALMPKNPRKTPTGRPRGNSAVHRQLLQLAANGPFTIGYAVDVTDRTYTVIAHAAGVMTKRHELVRISPGTYCLPPAASDQG